MTLTLLRSPGQARLVWGYLMSSQGYTIIMDFDITTKVEYLSVLYQGILGSDGVNLDQLLIYGGVCHLSHLSSHSFSISFLFLKFYLFI